VMASLPPFWTLAEAHAGELLRYARRLVGDGADDVVQESLLRALRSYPRLEHSDHLRAWLYRITTTTAFDYRNGHKEIATGSLPERAVDPEHYDDGFDALLHGLPNDTQRALQLRFVDDLSYDDIGKRLGCSSQAARQRVSTAVRRLRREMT